MKVTSQSLLAMMIGHPFYISEAGLRTIMAVAAREPVDPQDIQIARGSSVPSARDYSGMKVRGDVAIIPLYGPIVRHADLFDEISGATSLDGLADDLGVALEDPKVRSIVLDIDSTGGESNGVAEMAETIRAANTRKPITAYVGYMGASAAYYIATGAGRVVGGRRGFVGSIGSISAWTSRKAIREQMGLKDFVVVSSQTPKKGLDPETEEGLAELRTQLDFLADAFIQDVATYRGTSKKKVREEFGQGGIINTPRAAELGMIDDLGTLEGVIAAVSGGRKYRSSAPAGAAASAEVPVARKTFGEWLLGSRANDPAPDALQDASPAPAGQEPSPPVPAGRGPSDQGNPEVEDLRRQLAEERRLRQEAQADATEEARIQSKVSGWVRSGRVDPAQAAGQLKQCLDLRAADRALKFTGDGSLLARHEAMIDARKATGVCEEQVPSGNAEGHIQTPPSSPQSDVSAAARAAREKELLELKEFAAAQVGLGTSRNGSG